MAQQRTRKTMQKPPAHVELPPEEVFEPEYDDTEEPTSQLVSTGDIIGAKLTMNVHIGDVKYPTEAWVTYEFKTRVMDGETEEDASSRVIDVVNTRVLNMMQDADGRIGE